MRITLLPGLLCATLSVSGCGTSVPLVQEIGGPAEGQQLVFEIVKSVNCEIRNAFTAVMTGGRALKDYNQGVDFTEWLKHYGVQTTLTLTIKESGTIAPSAVGLPPSPASAVFSIAGGFSQSSSATRTDTLNYFYKVSDILKRGPCDPPSDNKYAVQSLLIQPDLKFREWLRWQTALRAAEINMPLSSKNPFGGKVLSHEIKFQVVSTGTLNPAWRLTLATINQGGTLLTASRDRTHDLLITLGPIDPTQPDSFVPAAANQHLARQIGIAVATDSRAP